MGYEFGFERVRDSSTRRAVGDDPFEGIFWNACGWASAELHDALVRACAESFGDVHDDVTVRVDALAFLERVYEHWSSQHLVDILVALACIDGDYAFDLWEPLPDFVKSAVRMSFFVDDLTPDQKEVCRELVRRFEYGDFDVLGRMVRALRRMREDGIDEFVLYCSF